MNYFRWIGHYENVLSQELCNAITEEDFNYNETITTTHEGQSTDWKKNNLLRDRRMDEMWIRKDNVYYEKLKNCSIDVVKRYSEEMKKNKRIFTAQKTTDFRLNKYDVGGFMAKHTDIHIIVMDKICIAQASLLFFLNDDYEGGDFIISNCHFRPKKGDAIIFPSNFMFPHEVKEVTKGTRWSIISWIM